MNRTGLALAGTVLAASIISTSVAKSQTSEPPGKPNILLIITDQQTATSMSCAGNRYVRTPAMDRLADSGVRFEKTYVTQPLCVPSRSSLQTGRYPHEIGIIKNGGKIKGDFPMLGNLVATGGYNCDYFGKWHVGATPESAGYEDYENVGKDSEVAGRAREYLLQEHGQPFFLTVSIRNPHDVCQLARGQELPEGPIGTPPSDLNLLPPLPENFDFPENEPTILRDIQNKIPVHYPTADWDELKWRQYLWGYYRLVEKADAEIGKVLDALAEGGHENNTVVIFTSDHGEGVAMHRWNQKSVLYDQATRVPLIISRAGRTMHRVYPELVSNALDIPATILDIAGVEKPPSMPGYSLVPIMEGLAPRPRDYVIAETTFARGKKNLGATGRMLRTGRFKYSIYDHGRRREQLFDMETDPGEMNNLAYDEKFNAELNRHRELITGWAKDTGDSAFPYQNPE